MSNFNTGFTWNPLHQLSVHVSACLPFSSMCLSGAKSSGWLTVCRQEKIISAVRETDSNITGARFRAPLNHSLPQYCDVGWVLGVPWISTLWCRDPPVSRAAVRLIGVDFPTRHYLLLDLNGTRPSNMINWLRVMFIYYYILFYMYKIGNMRAHLKPLFTILWKNFWLASPREAQRR